MNYNFCTIITANYVSYAYNLADSLLKTHSNAKLFVLICSKDFEIEGNSNIEFIGYQDINNRMALAINEKYFEDAKDHYRWSMKPVFMSYLLETKKIDKIVYVDCDVHFYSSYIFLFDLLDKKTLLLSPHFRGNSYNEDPTNYILQFTEGIYNGGFVASSQAGIPALKWWAERCLEVCEINNEKGQFFDQTHLNLLPIYFDNIHIIKHQGCNVANWNQKVCKRIKVNNKVLINGLYPIIFIHFTKSTIRGILNDEDDLLTEYLNTYLDGLSKNGLNISSLNIEEVGDKESSNLPNTFISTLINRTLLKLNRIIKT